MFCPLERDFYGFAPHPEGQLGWERWRGIASSNPVPVCVQIVPGWGWLITQDGNPCLHSPCLPLPPHTFTSTADSNNRPITVKARCHLNSFAAAFDLSSAWRYRVQSILWDALHSFVSYKTLCSILWAAFHKNCIKDNVEYFSSKPFFIPGDQFQCKLACIWNHTEKMGASWQHS